MGYLITGGTGFIGAYITRVLLQEGEDVVTYDLNPSREILERIMHKEDTERVAVVQGDITDLPHLIHVAQEHRVGRIIHMASMLSRASVANPSLAVQVNIAGTVNVLETARILGLKKVVLASSAGIYGPAQKYGQEYIPNDAPHYPKEIYAACKSFNEELAKLYFSDYGVDTIAIRYCIVYGFGQKGSVSATLTEELMVKPALGKPGKVPHGGETINWLYVEDAARATVMASKVAKTRTRAFNIDGDIHSVDEAADYVRRLIPKAELTVLQGPSLFVAKYDTTLIREEIGYYPEWTLEQGMKQVIDKVRREAQSGARE
jgi:nucleoside-diphosphate-sugar epimerase